jgi:glycosyltransferase involved in cell wall biosynthesis
MMRNWDNLILAIRLGGLCKEHSLDGLLAISAVESVILALSRCGESLVKIGSEHVYARHYPMPWLLGVCRRHLYPLLDAVVCPASKSAVALSEDCPRANVIHIPNLLVWPPEAISTHDGSELDQGRRRFITCGRLVFDKGFDVIIDAFASIAAKCSGWDLVIVGEGPAEEDLRRRADDKGLAERVVFTGFSDSVHKYYEHSDIFVFASPQEGFGMVIAEAQASGLPAICFDCLAGPSDIVIHGKTGILVPLGDAQGFAISMENLAHDSSLRASMKYEATRCAEKFRRDVVVPQWSAAFLNHCRRSSAKRPTL